MQSNVEKQEALFKLHLMLQVIEDREQGMIFNTMPTGSIQKLTQVANVNKVFNLEHHMAFSMHNFMCRIVREDRMPKTMEVSTVYYVLAVK